MVTLYNHTRSERLASNVRYCNHLWSRMKGLLGTKNLTDDEACWIVPCNSIHTVGMKFAIDAVFLDQQQKVVAILKDLKPNRLSPIVWKAHSVVEFASGHPKSCQVGDQLGMGGDRRESHQA